MEAVIKHLKPDIVIADMADKFTVQGSYTAAHEALKAMYVRFRVIGKTLAAASLPCLRCPQRLKAVSWSTSPCSKAVRQARQQRLISCSV